MSEKENHINNLDELKNIIKEKNDEIVTNYSKLTTNYKQLITNCQLNNTSDTIADCLFIGVVQKAWVVTKFALINVDTGITEYTSDKCSIGDTWTLDLSLLELEEGVQFHLKAEVEAGDDSTSPDILRYTPNGNWVTYDFKGTAFNTWFERKM